MLTKPNIQFVDYINLASTHTNRDDNGHTSGLKQAWGGEMAFIELAQGKKFRIRGLCLTNEKNGPKEVKWLYQGVKLVCRYTGTTA